MNIHEFFIHCEKRMPMVDTMEKLCEMKREGDGTSPCAT